MPTLNDFISTITNLVVGCGLAFQLPVVTYVLGKIGIVNSAMLKAGRKFAVVIILVLAAIITPSPDWSSQMLVAVPLYLLYEISIWLVKKTDKEHELEEKEWA